MGRSIDMAFADRRGSRIAVRPAGSPAAAAAPATGREAAA